MPKYPEAPGHVISRVGCGMLRNVHHVHHVHLFLGAIEEASGSGQDIYLLRQLSDFTGDSYRLGALRI
jgi:hypothetical protein